MKRVKLILMRHGESVWNKLNLFTGWVDVPLSEKGVGEALQGGKKIKDIPIDVVYTSSLIRAHTTAVLAMLDHSSKKMLVFLHPEDKKLSSWGKIYSKDAENQVVFVHSSWHLNERMYGALQGMNKDEARKKFGQEQVHIWRRSYDVAPPEGESLQMTSKRTIPYFEEKILANLKEGKNVFVSAHGNSLRSIVMNIEQLSKEEVVKLEIPTGEPWIYEYDGSLKRER